jgi:hypothetical protein
VVSSLRPKVVASVLVISTLGVALSSCGASNSTVGTSANNCLVSLAAALRSHHLGSTLVGVRLVSPEVAYRYHFTSTLLHQNVCLVGFKLSGTNGHRRAMAVYAYSENSANSIGVRIVERHRLRITHLI